MAPVSKLLVGGVAVAILQGCGDPKKDKTSDSKLEVTDIVDKKIVDQAHSNIDQIVVDVENIVENFVGNVGEQGVEKAAEQAASNAEDLQKKSQQIWNAVMSKKGGAIAAGVALTGTVAAVIGYKVNQAGRTCTVVGEGVSNKFAGLSYSDGQKVKFECATGYTLITDEEVTVECDANGKARISACSKNSLVKRLLGDSLVKTVGFILVLGGLWWLISRSHKQHFKELIRKSGEDVRTAWQKSKRAETDAERIKQRLDQDDKTSEARQKKYDQWDKDARQKRDELQSAMDKFAELSRSQFKVENPKASDDDINQMIYDALMKYEPSLRAPPTTHCTTMMLNKGPMRSNQRSMKASDDGINQNIFDVLISH